MIQTHILGFPRIGAKRELKFALEKYWRGESNLDELEEVAQQLRAKHWALQKTSGLKWVTVGDFAFYDHVANHIQLLGCEPARFKFNEEAELQRYFVMARGRVNALKHEHTEGSHSCVKHGEAASSTSLEANAALEMTKWFDTNYHYLVPEFTVDTEFALNSERLFNEVSEALALGHEVKAVLLGPLSFLWLGKAKSASTQAKAFDRLELLDKILPVYEQILTRLHDIGVKWVQIDEPILGVDLPIAWRNAFEPAYIRLSQNRVQLLLATYFSPLEENLRQICQLPIAGLHVDTIRAPHELTSVVDWLPMSKILSLGVIDGRNIWRTDLDAVCEQLKPIIEKRGANLWLAPSCSLLHVPVSLEHEDKLDVELKSWLSFACEKLSELQLLQQALNQGTESVRGALEEARQAVDSRHRSKRVHCADVKTRITELTEKSDKRHSSFKTRQTVQRKHFSLPSFPTTTIGSFPQTSEIRVARSAFKNQQISAKQYEVKMREEIGHAVRRQEALDIDVLVHGEAERNDMVEYFGEQLQGFAFTQYGWVQSYGSRCVKPPIIYGDVFRASPMTVEWSTYAQSLTSKPMKGMLTGPITILQWSFVRDDQPRQDTALQIALAIRDEVVDLERAGIRMIQIDEPAIREGLPLRHKEWKSYLNWATRAFRISASGVEDLTQIHTHMCYSEFNDILPHIAAMDADVITIETSRSNMELLEGFGTFAYPNEIGPGVYDIHSPRIPSTDEMFQLLEKAARVIPVENLWVNPDCGLKTRGWSETETALANMVAAAKLARKHLVKVQTN